MNWQEALLELYEKNRFRIGITEYRKIRTFNKKTGEYEEVLVPYVLLPVFHTQVVAQIEVIIDEEGNFIDAGRVAQEDRQTIIPTTDKSASRTSGINPHPLCDTLRYTAGDYGKYVREDKKDVTEYYAQYITNLKGWHLSPYTHAKVDAIYRYLSKRTLVHDLVRYKVLEPDESGLLSDNIKINGVSQVNPMIRFIVRADQLEAEADEECWKDRSLQDCFIRYYRSQLTAMNLDFLTGEAAPVSYLHPKKIRNDSDQAKLISANDISNFTFRGRFASKEEAFAVGAESSQKIHNALRWIIRRQGRNYETLCIVTWESEKVDVVPWDTDTEYIYSELMKRNQDVQPGEDTGLVTAEQFNRALDGYRKKVHHTSKMFLVAIDGATEGRLSLEEYQSLETARYLENIKKWHNLAGWQQTKMKDGRRLYYDGVPGIRDMVELLYGVEQDKKMVLPDKAGRKLYAWAGRRLIPCIWDGRNVPEDMVRLAENRASSPLSFREDFLWRRVLALACSLVKKQRYEREKEEWKVALDVTCKDRNYLYGRLLAVADRIEYRTFDFEKDSSRVTNAKRYMNTFSQRPFETWSIIEENLLPYFNKLSIVERRYYENLLDSIYILFDVEGYQDNKRLNGLYLLGFHSQSAELKAFRKGKTEGQES